MIDVDRADECRLCVRVPYVQMAGCWIHPTKHTYMAGWGPFPMHISTRAAFPNNKYDKYVVTTTSTHGNDA